MNFIWLKSISPIKSYDEYNIEFTIVIGSDFFIGMYILMIWGRFACSKTNSTSGQIKHNLRLNVLFYVTFDDRFQSNRAHVELQRHCFHLKQWHSIRVKMPINQLCIKYCSHLFCDSFCVYECVQKWGI